MEASGKPDEPAPPADEAAPKAEAATKPEPAPKAEPEQTSGNPRGSLSIKSQGKRFSNVFTMVPTVKPVMRFMPTYRMEPRVPLNREKCENIMKSVMIRTFDNFIYSPKYSLNLCAQVSEEIKNRIKEHNFDRYRYICVVTIGEKVMQAFCSSVNFLWDAEHDGYLAYCHETPEFFAMATLFYLYYD